MIVWENAWYNILLSFKFVTVDDDLSLLKSILNIILLLFLEFFISDEYLFSDYLNLYTLTELDKFPQSSISSAL